MNRRKKCVEEKRDLAVDDIVLVHERDTIRGNWPLGRVVEAYRGPDGHVRVVKVRTAEGNVVRGITKVCSLEIVQWVVVS